MPLLLDMAEYDEIGIVDIRGDYKDKIVKQSLSKNSNRAKGYLTPKARLAFIRLWKALSKALILQYFDLECHIQIEINTSSYAIGWVLSQLTLINLAQWHQVANYSQKMILAKTWYKTDNTGLLAIVKAFRT